MYSLRLIGASRRNTGRVARLLDNLKNQEFANPRKHKDVVEACGKDTGQSEETSKYNEFVIYLHFYKTILANRPDDRDLHSRINHTYASIQKYLDESPRKHEDLPLVLNGVPRTLDRDALKSMSRDAALLGARECGTEISPGTRFVSMSKRDVDTVNRNLSMREKNVLMYNPLTFNEHWRHGRKIVNLCNYMSYLCSYGAVSEESWALLERDAAELVNETRQGLLSIIRTKSGFPVAYVKSILEGVVDDQNVTDVLYRLEEDLCLYEDAFPAGRRASPPPPLALPHASPPRESERAEAPKAEPGSPDAVAAAAALPLPPSPKTPDDGSIAALLKNLTLNHPKTKPAQQLSDAVPRVLRDDGDDVLQGAVPRRPDDHRQQRAKTDPSKRERRPRVSFRTPEETVVYTVDGIKNAKNYKAVTGLKKYLSDPESNRNEAAHGQGSVPSELIVPVRAPLCGQGDTCSRKHEASDQAAHVVSSPRNENRSVAKRFTFSPPRLLMEDVGIFGADELVLRKKDRGRRRPQPERAESDDSSGEVERPGSSSIEEIVRRVQGEEATAPTTQ
uniref:Tegument protein pp150 n=1 Tax=Cardioderma bat herpesvirus TaxID=3141914 RepID=A0AAU7E290_9VIRU